MHRSTSGSGTKEIHDRTNHSCTHELGKRSLGKVVPALERAGVGGSSSRNRSTKLTAGETRGFSGKVRQRWMQPLRIYLTSDARLAAHRNRTDGHSARTSHLNSELQSIYEHEVTGVFLSGAPPTPRREIALRSWSRPAPGGRTHSQRVSQPAMPISGGQRMPPGERSVAVPIRSPRDLHRAKEISRWQPAVSANRSVAAGS